MVILWSASTPTSPHGVTERAMGKSKKKKHREEVKIAYFLYRNVVVKLRNNQDLNHNQLHNILRLFDVLPNFPFTTSETMRDYYL